MRGADGDGEKLQEPQPRAVVGRRDQRRQGQRGRGKGGELSHYPSLRQRAGAARGSTRRRAISACTCSWGVPGLGSSTAACRLNAATHGVEIAVNGDDIVGSENYGCVVVLAADVCSARPDAQPIAAWLRGLATQNCLVPAGPPGRTHQ